MDFSELEAKKKSKQMESVEDMLQIVMEKCKQKDIEPNVFFTVMFGTCIETLKICFGSSKEEFLSVCERLWTASEEQNQSVNEAGEKH